MTDSATLVPADKVARKLRLPEPYSQAVLEDCADAVEDSYQKVLGFLNRNDLNTYDVGVTALWWDTRYTGDDVKAWPQVSAADFDEQYVVKGYIANAEDPDLYDVTFTVGLPQEARDAITRFIIADARERLRTDPLFTEVQRLVTSVSREGMSVSYEKAATDPTATGGPIGIDALKKWRRLNIGRGTSARLRVPWPYADRL